MGFHVIRNSNRSVRFSLTLLHYTGFWPNRLTGSRLFLYRLYSVVCYVFILGFLIVPQSVDLYLMWGDLSAIMGNLLVFLTNAVHSFKLANFYWRNQDIQSLIDDSNEALTAETGDEQRRVIKRCDEVTLRDQIMYYSLTILLMTLWMFRAVGQLIMPARYPFDIESNPGRDLTRAHQMVAIMLASFTNMAKDTLVWSLMGQIQCRFTLLRIMLERLTQLSGDEENLESGAGERVMWARVRECVRRHEVVLRAHALLQSCFSPFLFAQLSVSVIIICTSAYQIANMPLGTFFVSVVAYLLIMVFEVFSFCWRGNEIITESASVSAAAGACEWYRCSLRARRALLLMASRAARPSAITAGGITVLSLETFVSILRGSYSIFNVLRSVDDEQGI